MSGGEVGEFLRARRARVRPEDVGLPAFGRRRVPGLRREEVAHLAGVSVDYYVRLEQGRGQTASDAVLDAVARVLRLDATERAHLRALVRPPREGGTPASGSAPQRVREGVRLLLDLTTGMPAFVLGRRMDVLAWNAPADALLGFSGLPPRERNMARHAFLDPAARALYPDWPEVAAETAAHLRLDAGRHPGDPRLRRLLDELTAGSPEFGPLWARQQVREKAHGRKRMRHPRAGELDVGYETLSLPGDRDQLLVLYTAEPGSPTAARLAALSAASPLAV
ncbi:helix-turn-helix transcriptional regulator [Streptomyces hoynatensis]|uniref:XRE family transcriptional regulator n=1 Tax=Streptomyces hoynatensis TaxID=1141874 RepID=A0A3A9YVY4_9ACTN|nr:helix-turn-helix transcriptional regulator [Streptomyces hoynatensis]RKN39754.1 XRE family transcriptional regulator [Streptomyces hoynatensis]